MSKIKVPHCRECHYYKQINFSWTPKRNNCKICGLKHFFMNYQEAKTSPKWCPLRLSALPDVKGI